jgi:hypothetical protein
VVFLALVLQAALPFQVFGVLQDSITLQFLPVAMLAAVASPEPCVAQPDITTKAAPAAIARTVPAFLETTLVCSLIFSFPQLIIDKNPGSTKPNKPPNGRLNITPKKHARKRNNPKGLCLVRGC